MKTVSFGFVASYVGAGRGGFRLSDRRHPIDPSISGFGVATRGPLGVDRRARSLNEVTYGFRP
jgi:hypothetical protein